MYDSLIGAVKGFAKPGPGASSRQVRTSGLVLLVAGVVVTIGGSILVAMLAKSLSSDGVRRAMTPVALIGITSACIGGYRLSYGVEPEEGQGSSLKRVLFGVGFIVGGFIFLVFSLIAVMLSVHAFGLD